VPTTRRAAATSATTARRGAYTGSTTPDDAAQSQRFGASSASRLRETYPRQPAQKFGLNVAHSSRCRPGRQLPTTTLDREPRGEDTPSRRIDQGRPHDSFFVRYSYDNYKSRRAAGASPCAGCPRRLRVAVDLGPTWRESRHALTTTARPHTGPTSSGDGVNEVASLRQANRDPAVRFGAQVIGEPRHPGHQRHESRRAMPTSHIQADSPVSCFGVTGSAVLPESGRPSRTVEVAGPS